MGYLSYEDVTVAGITVKHQKVTIMDDSEYPKDILASGFLGFGLPTLDTWHYALSDDEGHYPKDEYTSVFTNMYTKGHVAPIFGLTFNRPSSLSDSVSSGQLAIGGLPSVAPSTGYASTPFLHDPKTVEPSIAQKDYNIHPNAFVYNGSEHSSWDGNLGGAAKASDLKVSLSLDGPEMFLPLGVAEDVNALFDPPARYNESGRGEYTVSCSAKAPEFGVNIAGQTLLVNRTDLILPSSTGGCASSINHYDDPDVDYATMGEAFLRSVVAVFDIGSSEMRFAQREAY